jgi:phenylpropionate dioxygenase-like ring-hydroxylating dioxygenase large terminal subunit
MTLSEQRAEQTVVDEEFSGYLHRGIPVEDAELTHVGPGTPGGEYLRRYWHPIAMSTEIDNRPVALRILGEDLVAFRMPSGEIGLVHKHCPHRGASLEFGQVEAKGIRCAYHGWLIARGGRVLESPAANWACRLVHGAYPTREHRGLVFAYLGPPQLRPEFPLFDTLEQPGTRLIPFSYSYRCNYLQIGDNGMDPMHVPFLHAIGYAQFGNAWTAIPELQFVETPLGMIYVTVLRVGDRILVRSNDAIMPNISQGGSNWLDESSTNFFTRGAVFRWKVPVDDAATTQIGWRIFDPEIEPKDRFSPADIGKEKTDLFGQTEDKRSDAQRHAMPSDYDVIHSQRPIAIHRLEHLGKGDQGVIMLRRLLRKGIRQTQEGDGAAAMHDIRVRPIPTYTHDTYLDIPRRQTEEEDRELMRRIGREVSEIVLASAREEDRLDHARARLRTLRG